jgi:hypothetical protein
VVPKGGNKKRKVIELAAVNLESKLDPGSNRFAWLSIKAINGDRSVKEIDRDSISPD